MKTNTKVRDLVYLSIEHFKSSDSKDYLVKTVTDQLDRHYHAVKNIGCGLAADYVKAGEIFLRMITLYKLI